VLLTLLSTASLIMAVTLYQMIKTVRSLIAAIAAQTALLGHVADACSAIQRSMDGLDVISEALHQVWRLATQSQQLLTQIEERTPGISVRTRPMPVTGRLTRQHGRRAVPSGVLPSDFDWFTQQDLSEDDYPRTGQDAAARLPVGADRRAWTAFPDDQYLDDQDK